MATLQRERAVLGLGRTPGLSVNGTGALRGRQVSLPARPLEADIHVRIIEGEDNVC